MKSSRKLCWKKKNHRKISLYIAFMNRSALKHFTNKQAAETPKVFAFVDSIFCVLRPYFLCKKFFVFCLAASKENFLHFIILCRSIFFRVKASYNRASSLLHQIYIARFPCKPRSTFFSLHRKQNRFSSVSIAKKAFLFHWKKTNWRQS